LDTAKNGGLHSQTPEVHLRCESKSVPKYAGMVRNSQNRAEHEIRHGKKLAQRNPEVVWGWSTPAGQLRAQRRAQLIAKGAGLGPGVRVLELGCGTGLFTEKFAQTGAELVAIDISPDLLKIAKARTLPPERVHFRQGLFEEDTIEGHFDAVIGSSVLHHLDLERALPKISQLLKPSGILGFAEPNMLNPQIMLQKNIPWLKEKMGDSPDETAFVRWKLHTTLSEAGFDKIEIKPFDWLHPSTPKSLIPFIRFLGFYLERIPVLQEFAGSLYIRARRPGNHRSPAS